MTSSVRLSKFMFVSVAALTVSLGASPALAQSAAASFMHTGPSASPALPVIAAEMGDVVQDIRVEGAQRLEPETVISHLTLAKGDHPTPDAIDASLKSLYATGLFADARIALDGTTLVVSVDENPIINRITFEGNENTSKEDLEKELQLKPRQVYTLPRVQRDVQRILEVYRRSGRFAAVVEPKLIKLDQNRVDLVFEITEGTRTGVRSISIVGNNAFDDDALRQVVNTRESAWYKFFTVTDYYDPDRLNYDKELLRKFYLNAGYVDFRVLSAVAELTPDHKDFFITITVEENQRYKFGAISLKSEIKGLDAETLRKELTTHPGEWYSSDQIEKSITRLTTVLGDRQFAFITIVPETEKHKDNRTVDINYTIKSSERVYISRIDINGNNLTVDKVIRRQLQLAEGDPYSTSKIHKSEQNLKDLGFFEEAKVTSVQGAQPDRAALKVDVKEKSTGQIAIGAGFSSTDGVLGNFSISEHNFMGQGQDVRLGATVSGRTKQVDTSFTEPYFLDRDLSAGVDLFRTQTDNQNLSSYDSTSTGFGLRLGYPFSEDLRQRVNYSFHDDTIKNVGSDASIYIADQQGTSVTSSIGQELTYDTRDSKLDPTLGYVVNLGSDVAGLGGSRKWVRGKIGGTQYYPIADDYIVSGSVEGGEIWGLNGPTKINERYFLGGDNLRGFEYAGVGPRDISNSNKDSIGGNRFGRGSAELTTPTPLPPDLGLKAHFFVDAGVLDRADETQIGTDVLARDGQVRLSAGIGFTWASPFGPIRLDFAEPLMKRAYDKIQHIHFSFGTKF